MNGTLYSLIKQQYEKKNGSLKIVTDFDECLFSRQATAYHIYYQEITGKQVPFTEFFKEFWLKAEFKYEDYIALIQTSGIKEIEEERKKDPEATIRKTKIEICREKEDVYDYSPPLSIAADLLQALEEGLISEIVVQGNCSPWHKLEQSSQGESLLGDRRKRRALQKTFGKFPQVKLKVNVPIELQNGEKKRLSRAEFTAKEDPDFDIFIDDNPNTAEGVADLFPDKLIIMPDYHCNPVQRDNVYRIQVSVSSLSF